MRTGDTVSIEEHAIELYMSPIKSSNQRFKISYIDEDIAEVKLILENGELDWRITTVIPNTLVKVD